MQRPPPNLLINADDFGLNEKASGWIFRCIQEKLIHSFSVLPFQNKKHEKLLKEIVAQNSQIKIGVHLSLIETVPLLQGDGLDEPPPPRDYREFLLRYLSGKVKRIQVYEEWKAQIQFVGGMIGGTHQIAHLDSHQHVHVLPGLWNIARQLQQEFGIPRLRVPYESISRSLFHQFPFGIASQLLCWWRWNKNTPRLIGMFTSMHFTVAGNDHGLAEIKRKPDLLFELMVHPGQSQDSGDPKLAEVVSFLNQDVEDAEMKQLRMLQKDFGPK